MPIMTTYTVTDDRGVSWSLWDAERAERLSRAGLTVKAKTESTKTPVNSD